jgi:hypothetical protein
VTPATASDFVLEVELWTSSAAGLDLEEHLRDRMTAGTTARRPGSRFALGLNQGPEGAQPADSVAMEPRGKRQKETALSRAQFLVLAQEFPALRLLNE